MTLAPKGTRDSRAQSATRSILSEVVVELAGLADAAELVRIARFEPEAGGHVGASHQRDVLLVEQIEADEEPHLARPHRAPRERLEKGLAPARLHPEERVGDEQGQRGQIEEAIERVHLLDRALGVEDAPAHVALRAFHAECTIVGTAAREVDLGLRGRLARHRPVALEEAPFVGREAVRIGHRLGAEDAVQGALAGGQRLDEAGHRAPRRRRRRRSRRARSNSCGPRARVIPARDEPRLRQELARIGGAELQDLEVLEGRVAGDADEIVAALEQLSQIDGTEGALDVEIDHVDVRGRALLDGAGHGEELRHPEVAAATEEPAGPEQEDARDVGARAQGAIMGLRQGRGAAASSCDRGAGIARGGRHDDAEARVRPPAVERRVHDLEAWTGRRRRRPRWRRRRRAP